jgi:hypothetical protein
MLARIARANPTWAKNVEAPVLIVAVFVCKEHDRPSETP